jgi:putative NADH-flavin reductase
MMRIAVFGASGAIGIHFIKSALKEGHDLHLYSRKKIDLADPTKTKLFIGELSDYQSIMETIKGTDAVVSFLGPALKFSYPGMPIATGHENIIRAMKEQNVSRFITIATPAVKFEKDKTSIVTVMPRIMASLFMPKPYKEIVAVGNLTKSSGLDWTIIRFLAPINGEPTGKANVTFGDKKIGFKITRADIAAFALKELTQGEYIKSMPIIGS